MANWTTKHFLGIGVLISVMMIVTFVTFVRRGKADEEAFVITGQPQPSKRVAAPAIPPASNTAPTPKEPANATVHVSGAVKKPGVYRLDTEARVEAAVQAAGGPAADADLDALNLAARVEDGSKIIVPKKGVAAAEQPSGMPQSTPPQHSGHAGKFSQPGKESLNVNTASKEELQRLPGVGPAMAARIVDQRKASGRFTDAAQLMDVKGIGPKKFEKLRPYIRIR